MHERISVNALCFWGRPLPEVAEAWSQLRPRRVSFISPLIAGDFSPALAVAQAGGYTVETISHPFIQSSIDADEEALVEARANLSHSIQAAAAMGARSVYLVSGGHGSLTWEDAAERFAGAIEPCVAQAEAAGIALLVENAGAQNAHRHLAHSLRDALTLAEIAGIGVCMDIYNGWWEAGLRETIERAMPRMHLIQVGDYVYGDHTFFARAVPGDGDIPLRRIFDWALSAGYGNGFDLELIGPRIDAEGHLEATRRAAQNVGELLESLGA
jgi:sugar phosphate isomerase/epimerase